MHKYAESDGKERCIHCMSMTGSCSKHPHLPGMPSMEAVLRAIHKEIARARLLFPSCEGVGMAMLEEVGEVANAYLDEPRERILKETIQACAMLIRLALEGDPSLANLRNARALDR